MATAHRLYSRLGNPGETWAADQSEDWRYGILKDAALSERDRVLIDDLLDMAVECHNARVL
jgi:hypothetical protein